MLTNSQPKRTMYVTQGMTFFWLAVLFLIFLQGANYVHNIFHENLLREQNIAADYVIGVASKSYFKFSLL